MINNTVEIEFPPRSDMGFNTHAKELLSEDSKDFYYFNNNTKYKLKVTIQVIGE